MDEKTEARRNLRARLKSTLTVSEPPEFPTKLKWVLEMRLRTSAGGAIIGILPIELQHLCVLALKLEEVFSAEVHRRCVELFGKEKYDNEAVEFMIHQQVENDLRFNQAPKVWKILKRRVYRQWRDLLITPEGHKVIFFIDHQFQVFETPLRKLTVEESTMRLRNLLAELKAEAEEKRLRRTT